MNNLMNAIELECIYQAHIQSHRCGISRKIWKASYYPLYRQNGGPYIDNQSRKLNA